MKIIYATEINFSNSGGDVTHVIECVKALRDLNCDVRVFAPKFFKNQTSQYPLTYLLPAFRFRVLTLWTYEIRLLFFLMSKHYSWRPELVYIRSELYSLGAAIYARIFRLPMIIELNGDKIAELAQRNKSLFVRFVVDKIQSSILNHAQHIFVTAKPLRSLIIKKYLLDCGKVSYIHNAANHHLFRSISHEEISEVLSPEIMSFSSDPIVGFIGRFEIWQGLENLISAFEKLQSENQPIKCVLVGDGPLFYGIESMIKELKLKNIILTGAISKKNIPYYINFFDICVLPRNRDIIGEPVKLYEYLSCGKPVVAPRIKDFEFIESQKAGLLFEPGDDVSLANAVKNLLSNPNKMKQMGKNGRKMVESIYNWEQVAHTIKGKCLDLIAKQ
jgi:starch synthase